MSAVPEPSPMVTALRIASLSEYRLRRVLTWLSRDPDQVLRRAVAAGVAGEVAAAGPDEGEPPAPGCPDGPWAVWRQHAGGSWAHVGLVQWFGEARDFAQRGNALFRDSKFTVAPEGTVVRNCPRCTGLMISEQEEGPCSACRVTEAAEDAGLHDEGGE